MNKKQATALFLRELKRLLLFLILGGLLVLLNPDPGDWKFPMAMTQEWRVLFRKTGYIIMIFAYPLFSFIRLLIYLRNNKS